MSLEENKAIVRRYVEEVHNRRNLDVIDEIFAPNYVYHGTDVRGPQGKREQQAWMHAHLSDIRSTIEHLIAEGDMVVVRYTFAFTHSSPFLGVATTGKRVTTTGTV
jgi:predicted ester cyclase